MTTTVALIDLICIVFLGSGADKNSNICPYVGAAWGHIYLLALCSRNVHDTYVQVESNQPTFDGKILETVKLIYLILQIYTMHVSQNL